MNQEKVGMHSIIDFYGCKGKTSKDDVAWPKKKVDLLTDQTELEWVLTLAARTMKCKVVTSIAHGFKPRGKAGASVVLFLEESHMSIHTWPERQYAAVDIFTCDKKAKHDHNLALEKLKERLKPQTFSLKSIPRGQLE